MSEEETFGCPRCGTDLVAGFPNPKHLNEEVGKSCDNILKAQEKLRDELIVLNRQFYEKREAMKELNRQHEALRVVNRKKALNKHESR